jgi:GNAT superfamily N-acetyltransferase
VILSLKKAAAAEIPQPHTLLVTCGKHMHETLGFAHWDPYLPLDEFIRVSAGHDLYGVYDAETLVATFSTGTTPRPYYNMASLWDNLQAKALYLGRFGVLPQYQHHGIGGWCMVQVDRLRREMGCAVVRFDALGSHSALLAFYDKLGYQRRGIIQRDWGDLAVFEKILSE